MTQRQRPKVVAQADSGAGSAAGSWWISAMPSVFVLMWSSAFIAGVIGVDAGPPLLLVFARFSIAGVVLALVALATRAPWPRGRLLGHIMVTGLLIQAVQFGAFYVALNTGLPAAVVALMQGLNPIVVALLATVVLDERLGSLQWLGFALGGLGVALAVAGRVNFSVGGLLLCILGLLGLSVGTVYQKRFCPNMDLRSGTAVQFLVSVAPIGVLTLALEQPRVHSWSSFGASIAWIVLVNSIGTFVLLNLMLRRSAASKVSALFFLTPGVTAMLAWVLIGQHLSALVVTGLVVGGAGVLLATLKPKSRPGSPAEAGPEPVAKGQ
ncbi:DMT family transporter [Actinomadura sp. HBU206391]|uniref:DMT family transporter n=1 Tax=Actinomadura sp. HBU206391 TaxID=2731692 RepID=UPI00164FC76F|nr:DMT family transporter [Actinomadura sp. HBU206391]MBC6461739.1 DMT family transporter [Actinomadura sp. HBU206391]